MRRDGWDMRVGSKQRGWMERVIAGGLAFAAALALAGCAEFEPDGRKAPPILAVPSIPAEAPKTTGVETPAAAEHRRLVDMFGGEYHWPAAERHLNGILA